MKVKINQSDIKKIERLINHLSHKIQNDFNEVSGTTALIAEKAYQQIQFNVKAETYKNKYKPLSKKYKQYKKSIKAPEGFWRLSDSFYLALHRWFANGSWWAGIERKQTGFKKKYIAIYAKVNEKMRPLIRPTAIDFAPKAKQMWIKGVANIIKRAWKNR